MKYKTGHKETTRRRIVESATRQFRERGFKGASIPSIMRDAGLTVGGFYRHFDSKDELFRTALEEAMGETLKMLRRQKGQERGDDWIQKAAAVYLHPAHRANVAQGCPLPVLTAEVARGDSAARNAFGDALSEMVEEVRGYMGEDGEPAPRREALGFLAVLVGGLLLSRGVEDEALAEEVLRASRETARTRPREVS